MVRGKFYVASITEHAQSTAKSIKLQAVGDDGIEENRRYHKYTPSGSIEMFVDNPPAAAEFKVGKSFYVDFTPIE